MLVQGSSKPVIEANNQGEPGWERLDLEAAGLVEPSLERLLLEIVSFVVLLFAFGDTYLQFGVSFFG